MSSQIEPSPMTFNTLELDEFPPHSYDDWKTAAEQLLKGAPFEKRLIARTYEGFNLQPLYRQDDLKALKHLGGFPGAGNYHRGTRAAGFKTYPWKVAQETAWKEPEAFNKMIQVDLNHGVTEIVCPTGGSDGLKIHSINDLRIAFENVDLKQVGLTLDTQDAALPNFALLIAYLRSLSADLEQYEISLVNDPIGALVSTGESAIPLGQAFSDMGAITQFASQNAPNLKTVTVSGRPYADGGGSASQELGYALATGLFYLREMKAAGIVVSDSAKHIRFSFSIGRHFFIEIAKFRAARILWSRIVAAMGGNESAGKMQLHARTGYTNKTLYDPHVNLLRSCTEALSAVIGGCDSLTIAPFDELNPQDGYPSRRIARNMHAIIADECALNRVIDPGGGSYYLEHLTDQLAEKAWTIFQSTERAGGILAALQEGIPQAEIRATAKRKAQNVATRRETLVGTNLYPNQNESLGSTLKNTYQPELTEETSSNTNLPELQNKRIHLAATNHDQLSAAIEAAEAGATLLQIAGALKQDTVAPETIEPIPLFRLSQDYEQLRQATETVKNKTGVPPSIFQINLGPSGRYRMRADWTSSFFQVGGLKVLNDRDFDTLELAIKAVSEEAPALAILVSDDASYETSAAPIALALKEALPNLHLLIAGAPGDNEEALRAAGIDGFIHIRLNNYQTLKSILEELGVLP